MNKIDLIWMGLKNLWRRKLRTSLTVLGVLIGTSSIIMTISLGYGLEESNKEMISQYGSLTKITVQENWDKKKDAKGNVIVLDDNAVAYFHNIKHVQAVSPIMREYGAVLAGKKVAGMSIIGVDPKTMQDFEYKTADGRLLKEGDRMAGVIGHDMAREFRKPNSRDWKEQPPIDIEKGKFKISLDNSYAWGSREPGESNKKGKTYKLNIVGMFDERDYENSYSIVIPVEELNKMIKDRDKGKKSDKSSDDYSYGGMGRRGRSESTKGYSTILVKVDEIENVAEVQETIKTMGYNAYSNNEWLESTKKTTNLLKSVFGAVGAVALLVAAIGITNTMIMSIYERTREIGIMKVVGASIGDIKQLFLFESAIIGVIGGIVGVFLSLIFSHLLNKYGVEYIAEKMDSQMSILSVIPFWLLWAAVIFSAVIGLVAGYLPARRATRLSALDAIKTE